MQIYNWTFYLALIYNTVHCIKYIIMGICPCEASFSWLDKTGGVRLCACKLSLRQPSPGQTQNKNLAPEENSLRLRSALAACFPSFNVAGRKLFILQNGPEIVIWNFYYASAPVLKECSRMAKGEENIQRKGDKSYPGCQKLKWETCHTEKSLKNLFSTTGRWFNTECMLFQMSGKFTLDKRIRKNYTVT